MARRDYQCTCGRGQVAASHPAHPGPSTDGFTANERAAYGMGLVERVALCWDVYGNAVGPIASASALTVLGAALDDLFSWTAYSSRWDASS